MIIADAQALPVGTSAIDRACADRVLMHLNDPPRALSELRRVMRPGGLVALAEPDWDTLAIDHPDLDIARAFTRFIAEHANRHQAMGRQVAQLAENAGFTIRSMHNTAPVLDDFATAESILQLRLNTERTVTAGYLTHETTHRWIRHLTRNPFRGTCIICTAARQPRSHDPLGRDRPHNPAPRPAHRLIRYSLTVAFCVRCADEFIQEIKGLGQPVPDLRPFRIRQRHSGEP